MTPTKQIATILRAAGFAVASNDKQRRLAPAGTTRVQEGFVGVSTGGMWEYPSWEAWRAATIDCAAEAAAVLADKGFTCVSPVSFAPDGTRYSLGGFYARG